MDSNTKIKQVGFNINDKANLIWNVANSLFGAYKPHEYGLVILPLAVIKRFHDCLLPTHDKVRETYLKSKNLQSETAFFALPLATSSTTQANIHLSYLRLTRIISRSTSMTI